MWYRGKQRALNPEVYESQRERERVRHRQYRLNRYRKEHYPGVAEWSPHGEAISYHNRDDVMHERLSAREHQIPSWTGGASRFEPAVDDYESRLGTFPFEGPTRGPRLQERNIPTPPILSARQYNPGTNIISNRVMPTEREDTTMG